MLKLQTFALAVSSIIALGSSAHAADGWICQYARQSGGQSLESFSVRGGRLIAVEGDVQSEYVIVANDERAIVAAYGGAYDSEPAVMAFTVMIDKADGRFVRSTASVSTLSYKETGMCRKAVGGVEPALPEPAVRDH